MTRSIVLLVLAAAVACASLCAYADSLADGSFAWHMGQHLVLLFVIPALLLLAEPFTLVRPHLPKPSVVRLLVMTEPLRRLMTPAATLCFFIAVLWVTHFSSLYERSLENDLVHASEHALYLLAGVLFWIPVIAPAPMSRLPYPTRLLYLLVALPQGALLAFALDAARAGLYPHYAAILGVRALEDQRNAAAVMWIGGGLTIFGAFLTTLALWASRERRALAYSSSGE